VHINPYPPDKSVELRYIVAKADVNAPPLTEKIPDTVIKIFAEVEDGVIEAVVLVVTKLVLVVVTFDESVPITTFGVIVAGGAVQLVLPDPSVCNK